MNLNYYRQVPFTPYMTYVMNPAAYSRFPPGYMYAGPPQAPQGRYDRSVPPEAGPPAFSQSDDLGSRSLSPASQTSNNSCKDNEDMNDYGDGHNERLRKMSDTSESFREAGTKFENDTHESDSEFESTESGKDNRCDRENDVTIRDNTSSESEVLEDSKEYSKEHLKKCPDRPESKHMPHVKSQLVSVAPKVKSGGPCGPENDRVHPKGHSRDLSKDEGPNPQIRAPVITRTPEIPVEGAMDLRTSHGYVRRSPDDVDVTSSGRFSVGENECYKLDSRKCKDETDVKMRHTEYQENDDDAIDEVSEDPHDVSNEDVSSEIGDAIMEDEEREGRKGKKVTEGKGKPYQRHNKPPFSYITLIAMAIRESPTQRLTLSEINDYLMKKFEFFTGTYTGWRNSIRHNLSLNECFVKVLRDPARPWGKDNYWIINPNSEYVFTDGVFRRRRRRTAKKGKGGDHPGFNIAPPHSLTPRHCMNNMGKFSSSFSIDSLLNKAPDSKLTPEAIAQAAYPLFLGPPGRLPVSLPRAIYPRPLSGAITAREAWPAGLLLPFYPPRLDYWRPQIALPHPAAPSVPPKYPHHCYDPTCRCLPKF